jgi:enoyl-CoA hydratase/carnithine racemase
MSDATAFANGPTQAYAAAKRAVSRGFDQPLEEGLAIEAEQFARAFASNDAKVGVAAFLAKEKPDFSGT